MKLENRLEVLLLNKGSCLPLIETDCLFLGNFRQKQAELWKLFLKNRQKVFINSFLRVEFSFRMLIM